MMKTLLRSVLALCTFSFGLGCASLSCLSDDKEAVPLPGRPQANSDTASNDVMVIASPVCRLTERLWFDRKEQRLVRPGEISVPTCSEERELLIFATVWQRFSPESFFYTDMRLFLGLDLPDKPLRGTRVFVRNQRYPLTEEREGDHEPSLLSRTADLSTFALALHESGAVHTRDLKQADYVISSTVAEVAPESENFPLTIEVEACATRVASGQEVLCLGANGYEDTTALEEFFTDFIEELSYQHVAPQVSP